MWCFLRRCVGCLNYFGVYNLKLYDVSFIWKNHYKRILQIQTQEADKTAALIKQMTVSFLFSFLSNIVLTFASLRKSLWFDSSMLTFWSSSLARCLLVFTKRNLSCFSSIPFLSLEVLKRLHYQFHNT